MSRRVTGRNGWMTVGLLAGVLLWAGTALVRAEDAAKEGSTDDDDAKVKAAMTAFQGAYKGDDDAKVNAIEALAEVRHPKVFATIAGLLMGGENEVIKQAAARALGHYKDKRVGPHLTKAFEAVKKEPKVLEAVITSMGATGDVGLAETLGKYAGSKGTSLDKKTIDSVNSAVTTLGKLPCKDSVESLIKLGQALNGMSRLDNEKIGMRNTLMQLCCTALKDVTGQDPKADDSGKIIDLYAKWWKANEKTWDPTKPKKS